MISLRCHEHSGTYPNSAQCVLQHDHRGAHQDTEGNSWPRVSITDRVLIDAETDLREFVQSVKIHRGRRDRLIRQALVENWSHQQIADATGLTRGRIGQIAKTHA